MELLFILEGSIDVGNEIRIFIILDEADFAHCADVAGKVWFSRRRRGRQINKQGCLGRCKGLDSKYLVVGAYTSWWRPTVSHITTDGLHSLVAQRLRQVALLIDGRP